MKDLRIARAPQVIDFDYFSRGQPQAMPNEPFRSFKGVVGQDDDYLTALSAVWRHVRGGQDMKSFVEDRGFKGTEPEKNIAKELAGQRPITTQHRHDALVGPLIELDQATSMALQRKFEEHCSGLSVLNHLTYVAIGPEQVDLGDSRNIAKIARRAREHRLRGEVRWTAKGVYEYALYLIHQMPKPGKSRLERQYAILPLLSQLLICGNTLNDGLIIDRACRLMSKLDLIQDDLAVMRFMLFNQLRARLASATGCVLPTKQSGDLWTANLATLTRANELALAARLSSKLDPALVMGARWASELSLLMTELVHGGPSLALIKRIGNLSAEQADGVEENKEWETLSRHAGALAYRELGHYDRAMGALELAHTRLNLMHPVPQRRLAQNTVLQAELYRRMGEQATAERMIAKAIEQQAQHDWLPRFDAVKNGLLLEPWIG